jgi:hypothetical protein
MTARAAGLHRDRAIGVRVAGALLWGAGLAALPSCARAQVGVTAERPAEAGLIDQVQLGFALNLEGRVGMGCTSSRFALRDPIHLSMKVTGAAPGSIVSVSVRDVGTHRVAWSEARPVPPGTSYATFEIGSQLPEGRYRAESTLGGASTNPREFLVHVWNGNAR